MKMKFFSLLGDEQKRRITERRNNPCSQQQIRYYEDNWEKILRDDIMIPHLKKGVKNQTSSVLHGGKSMNIILANDDPKNPYYKKSQDWDIYAAKHPKKISKTLEKKLDKKIGCNICESINVNIPKITMTEGKVVSTELWRINTPHTSKDPESIIDVMDLPSEVSVIRHKGKYGTLRHESLMDSYMKMKSGILHPVRSFKASSQKQLLQAFLREKYGKSFLVEDNPEDLVFSKSDTTKRQMEKNRGRLAFPKAYRIIETERDWTYQFSYELYDKFYHKGGQPKSKNNVSKNVVKKTIPKIIVDNGKRYTLHSKHTSKSQAKSSSTQLRNVDYNIRNKFINNGGKKIYLVYKRRK